MGRVPPSLELVVRVRHGSLGRTDEVDDDHAPIVERYSRHLSKTIDRMSKVMEQPSADDEIELARREGDRLGSAKLEAQVR